MRQTSRRGLTELQNGQPLSDEQAAFMTSVIEQIWEGDK